ncbi:glycosyltransferase family 2 protein [Nostocaceae cyanobacterium CENA357]|uniref:Glycosyltransferase family 2 protein n=1 Tax=Atlanticothrix silvestris CENA357 TaxID=1725252 RepID=A0A8J7H6T9_9CYAN|nr:glycosyltransferase family 2 protein [Atlanticothrix silvestris]MBH8551191.1 glycosyltransferase family 2 protein [Atlanticothrix silvestris CENA357]
MLVFVIPLKSPQVSKSWERVTKLFERCIKSVCNQTSPDFRAIVVCHEKPRIDFAHPHITYLTVDFPPANETNPVAQGNTDKGRKILKGLIYAQQFYPTHTMAVDADDCVSKKLAEFVNQNPNCHGWFINKGYKYQEGSKYIYLKRSNFYKMCGTCNIIRYDLNNIPETAEYNRGYGYYKYYIDHAQVRDILKRESKNINPLPFAGAVYVVETGEHLFYDSNRLKFNIFNRRLLNESLRNEFGLHNSSNSILTTV